MYLTTSAANSTVATVVPSERSSLTVLTFRCRQHLKVVLEHLLLLMDHLLMLLLLLLLLLLKLNWPTLFRHLMGKVASPYAKPSALDARRCARRVLQDLTSASEAAKV